MINCTYHRDVQVSVKSPNARFGHSVGCSQWQCTGQCHRSAARWNGHLSSSTPTISAFYLSNEFCKAFFYARTTSALNSSVNTCYNGNDTHDDKRGSRPAINPAIDHTLALYGLLLFSRFVVNGTKIGSSVWRHPGVTYRVIATISNIHNIRHSPLSPTCIM